MDSMRPLVIAALIMGSVACTRSEPAVPVVPSASGSRPSTNPIECPATLPNGNHRREDPAGLGEQGFGNAELWVGLWPQGRVRATEDNLNRRGEILMKFPWDRGVRGHLQITGRRLDADAPPLRAQLSDYGSIGFQPSTLVFPTEGCWEVTGRVGRSSLTFVTSVRFPR
jgi:hypothetical protein